MPDEPRDEFTADERRMINFIADQVDGLLSGYPMPIVGEVLIEAVGNWVLGFPPDFQEQAIDAITDSVRQFTNEK